MIPKTFDDGYGLLSREELDLFSTSQKVEKICHRQAPLICIPPEDGKPGFLYQSCCNDWLCPRCGEIRAKEEYGRIVRGCDILGVTCQLYFVTLTCAGKVDLKTALDNYLLWTNRLLSTMRAQAKTSQQHWAYVQVTEPQKRQHPHSHLIMASKPTDAKIIVDHWQSFLDCIDRVNEKIPLEMRFTPNAKKEYSHHEMYSEWLMLAAVKCGLGVQCRISIVDTTAAVARYVAKYLFKVAMTAKWSKNWRRVRYSQSFPKTPENATTDAFVVLSKDDWKKLSRINGTIETDDYVVYRMAMVRHIWSMRLIPPKSSIHRQK